MTTKREQILSAIATILFWFSLSTDYGYTELAQQLP
jgi:hypothetical protein